ncbi:MAG: hypothetical protein SV765_12595 [Pseudomonadota bacterium]|nr:hypothetical protein [Pseudomonadales bacterium]MDY6921035.1 hypothetical protein [Pseudomonadota bacterium]
MTRKLFDNSVVQQIMPHRFPIALLDYVSTYSPQQRHLQGVKLITANEPWLMSEASDRSQYLPSTLLYESVAQSCGMLMNLEYLQSQGLVVESLNHGCESVTAIPPVPHSVFAECAITLMQLARVGDEVLMDARISLQRAKTYVFQVEASVSQMVIAKGRIILAYPDYVS